MAGHAHASRKERARLRRNYHRERIAAVDGWRMKAWRLAAWFVAELKHLITEAERDQVLDRFAELIGDLNERNARS